MLTDSYGRVATDLRVSLTDRCKLRCAYCMPAEGLDWLPRPDLLTDDEVIRLIRIGVELLGIREIRFTGGEPLLRRGLAGIIERTARLVPRPEISLTTNAIGLARLARPLRPAGLDRVNVSLDTLRPETFRTLTHRDGLPEVLAGLDAAAGAGLAPVKVNTVLMRGINDDEAPDLLRFCLAHHYELRFIEQMPLDAQHGWRRENMVTAEEILDALSEEFTLKPDDSVEFHPAWHDLMATAVTHGLHAAPWRQDRPGAHVARAAAVYVWGQAEAGHLCPISMTYAIVPALRHAPELARQFEPLLAAPRYDFGLRPPLTKNGLLAGMSMTEKQGGSDVRANTTTAVRQADGTYRITGH